MDVSFPVQGSKAGGKVFFTSIRKSKQSKFEILRWKIIMDDGTSIDLAEGL